MVDTYPYDLSRIKPIGDFRAVDYTLRLRDNDTRLLLFPVVGAIRGDREYSSALYVRPRHGRCGGAFFGRANASATTRFKT